MYGHQFYMASVAKKVEYLNRQLKEKSLEEIADSHFLDMEDIKTELSRDGFYFVPDLNQFVQCDKGNVA